jgi:hypothetical protein
MILVCSSVPATALALPEILRRSAEYDYRMRSSDTSVSKKMLLTEATFELLSSQQNRCFETG